MGFFSFILITSFTSLWTYATIPDYGGTVESFFEFERSGRRQIYNAASVVLLITVLFIVLIGTTVLKDRLMQPRPATISLSQRSKEHNAIKLAKYQRRWMGLALSITATIVFGVVSSLIASSLWDIYSAGAQ
jgi:hypothetical protein